MSNRSVISVTVFKIQGDLYGYKFFDIPYTYNSKAEVPIYASMVKELIQSYLPVNKNYKLHVGHTYTDFSYDEYDSVYDVTLMPLSAVLQIIPNLTLQAVREKVHMKRVEEEHEEMVSVNMGHWNHVRLEHESQWNNTFIRIEVPRKPKYNSSYMRKMYRESIAQTLFNGYEHKVSIKGDPYVHGNFRMERTSLNGNPVIAIYENKVEFKWEKEVTTETVEL